MDFENKIAQLRKDKGITQEELAEKIGVSRQAVAKWEAGQSVPEITTLIQIADCFEVSLDLLVGRVENETEALITTMKDLIKNGVPDDENEGAEALRLIRNFVRLMKEKNIPAEEIVNGILYMVEDD